MMGRFGYEMESYMKKLLIILLWLPILSPAQSWDDLKKAADKLNTELKKTAKKVNVFSEKEAATALKEALNKGIEKGVNVLSLKDGFYGNKKVKIPFPPEASRISKKLKQLGMKKQINKVVLSLNRAAEDASISAKPIFVDAIKKMTIKDAISIVKGDSTAGTDYLNKNTNSALVEAFKPIIKSSLQKVKATKYWKDIMGVYNKIPSVKKINPDLEYYVTRKAIEGLFFMIAEEEIEIRKNPQKRITELLKKVFGS